MPSDSGERRTPRAQNAVASLPPPPKSAEPLPCPRCESINTKFCYYNNYNLSQPRHFCKSCRRYWTQGGTLRNVPVGGGTRKNSKRSRSSSSSSSSCSTVTSEPESEHVPANPMSVLPGVKPETVLTDVNVSQDVPDSGNFSSLLNSQGQGFLALSGYGLGLGSGFDEIGLGFGRGVWTFPGAGYLGGGDHGSDCGGGGGEVGVTSGCDTWQGGEGGLVDGDCFTWPGLAISTPGEGLK